MKQYEVTGMSCAACSARVEKAVSQVPGVTSCSVSLLTNSMGVEGQADPTDIVAAVEAGGRKKQWKSDKEQHRLNYGRAVKRQRDACFKETTDSVSLFFASADVCLNGTYDVGMAASGAVCRKSCGSWSLSNVNDSDHYGH